MRELGQLLGVTERSIETVSYPDTVIYAGQSARRKAFLDDVFPDVPTLSFSVDPEPTTSDLEVILEDKLIKGIHYLASLDGQIISNKTLIIAADTRTIVPLIRDGLQRESLGKPHQEDDVLDIFRQMSESADITGESPYYEVASISGSVSTEKRSLYTGRSKTRITLNAETIEALATMGGFQQYLDLFHSFYSSGPYEKEGMPKQDLTDLSAGLSLPVLLKLGAVEQIDGEGPTNTEALRNSFFTVAVGIQPDVVRPFNQNVLSMFSEWEWFNKVIIGLNNE